VWPTRTTIPACIWYFEPKLWEVVMEMVSQLITEAVTWPVWEALMSALALRLYFGIGVLVASGIAFHFSRRELLELDSFDENSPIRGFRTETVSTVRGYEERNRLLREHANGVWGIRWRGFEKLVLFGIIVPAAILAIIATQKDWLFDPQDQPILVNGEAPNRKLESTEIAQFVIDQSLKGAANDLAEVFNINIGDVKNNPHNLVFSGLVVLFRIVTGGAGLAIGFFFYRIARSVLALRFELLANRWRILKLMWQLRWSNA